jgi:hypothetical protein
MRVTSAPRATVDSNFEAVVSPTRPGRGIEALLRWRRERWEAQDLNDCIGIIEREGQ